jgi:hypothetical protein
VYKHSNREKRKTDAEALQGGEAIVSTCTSTIHVMMIIPSLVGVCNSTLVLHTADHTVDTTVCECSRTAAAATAAASNYAASVTRAS